MVTERYQAPYGALDAASGAVRTMTALQLAKWARRWVVWLPVAWLISMVDPVIAPLRWWATGFALASLAFILLLGWFLRRKIAGTAARVVDLEATIHEHEDDMVDLDLPAIDHRP